MAGQQRPPSWDIATVLSLLYTCGEKCLSSGDNLLLPAYPKNSLGIKEKESLISGEASVGKIKPWISEKVRQEGGSVFWRGRRNGISVREACLLSHETFISAWKLLLPVAVVLRSWSPYLVHLRGKLILRALLGHRLWVP